MARTKKDPPSGTGTIVCVWSEDPFDGSWDTACGEKFVLLEGGPKDNKMRFCCYCGKPLAELKPL